MKQNLVAKQTLVKELHSYSNDAVSAIVADYSGLTVNQMNELRTKGRETGIYMRVVRNTLAKRAFEDTQYSCLNEKLIGPIFLAFSTNSPSDAPRLFKDFCKTNDKLVVKAISIDGKIFGSEQLSAIASLPNRDEAIGTLMAVFKAPIEKLVRTKAGVIQKLLRTLIAVKDAKTS